MTNLAKAINPDNVLHRVYAIYDSKMAAYLPPFLQRNDQVAIRSMIGACQDPNSNFHIHAGDYSLFYIGVWDEDTAQYSNANAPENLGTLLSLVSAYGMPTDETSEES